MAGLMDIVARNPMLGLMAPQQPPQGDGLMENAGEIVNRGSILPLGRNTATGNVELAWPQAALDAWGAVQLPGRVYQGHQPTMDEVGNLAMTFMGGGLLGTAPKGALRAGPIRAYHASPHDFDKFDSSKIGSGEGAQAYGRGLYFSESEAVSGKGGVYDQAFSGRYLETSDGRRIGYGTLMEEIMAEVAKKHPGLHPDQLKGIAKGVLDQNAYVEDVIGMGEPFESAYKTAIAYRGGPVKDAPAKVYEVQIQADPEKDFMDWDQRLPVDSPEVARRMADEMELMADNDYGLYQKRDAVQAAIDAYVASPQDPASRGRVDRLMREAVPDYGLKEMEEKWATTRGEAFREVEREIGPADAQRSLLDQGYKGIKFLDGLSRSHGEGTRNYVVFDDSLIEILRKYGWAGLAPGAGLMSMFGGGEAQN